MLNMINFISFVYLVLICFLRTELHSDGMTETEKKHKQNWLEHIDRMEDYMLKSLELSSRG